MKLTVWDPAFLSNVCGALGSIKKSCFAGGLTQVGVWHISTETRNVSIVQSRFFFHISFSSPAAESVRTKQSLKEYGVFCLSSNSFLFFCCCHNRSSWLDSTVSVAFLCIRHVCSRSVFSRNIVFFFGKLCGSHFQWHSSFHCSFH